MKSPLHRHVGWVSWLVLFTVIVVVLANDADRRGVSHIYEWSARNWLDAKPLYVEGYKGFLYAPQSAMSYVPFLWPTDVVGSFGWRLLGIVLLATGLTRLLTRLVPDRDRRRFTIATWLLVPVTISSLRNGQSNLHLAGIFLHMTVVWMDGRRAALGTWSVFALLAKPVAIVPALLAGATTRRLVVALLIAFVVFAAMPFAHADPGYAWEQVQAFVDKLQRASDPGDHVYSNLEGIFHKAHAPIPAGLRRPLQIAAALATLALAFWARRRVRPKAFPFAVMTLAALYLMLFNPRNESNSFVILGAFSAVLGAVAWTSGRWRDALLLSAFAVAWGCDNYGRWLHGPTGRWFKPFVALLFLAYFLRRLSKAPKQPLLPLEADNPSATATMPA